MKLNLKKRKMNPKTDDSWRHCCKYCHYYDKGSCMYNSGSYAADFGNWFNDLSESGTVQGVIEETMNEKDLKVTFLKDIMMLASKHGLRKNKEELSRFREELMESFESFVKDCSPAIDGNLCACCSEVENSLEISFEIDNPSEYYCSHWE